MGYKVTGIGLICGLGNSPQEVFNKMCSGETAFREIYTFDGSKYAQKMAGQLREEDDALLAEKYENEDRALAMARYAGEQALKGNVTRNDGRALVLATNFGPMETLQWSWQEKLDTGEIDEFTYAPANDYVVRLAQELGCGAGGIQCSMSCASGAAAVALGWDMLSTGKATSCLVICYDSLSEYCWCGLSNLHTITSDTMRPFDARRSGTIFSEGAAAMLLELPSSDSRELAWIDGVATNNNAFHLTAPRPEAEGSRMVMEAAIGLSGIAAEKISHVCAHATSTKANDSTESAAIRNLFKNVPEEAKANLTVSAHKSQLGHLLGAAGMAEAIVSILAMRNSLIPPTVNLTEMDEACKPLNCIGATAQSKSFDAFVTNSAGIGGNNASIVIAKYNTDNAAIQLPEFRIQNIGWVLPGHIGSGMELLEHPEWLENGDNSLLDNFSPREYITSVKGYLDPAGAFFLAASKLAVGETQIPSNRCGIVSFTQYGSQKSSFTFFNQFAEKGPRFASPMIFPHGYANTPGNLAAIELGCAGPHIVFYGNSDKQAAFDFAAARLADGSADMMLVGFYEAVFTPAMPTTVNVTNGAVVYMITK